MNRLRFVAALTVAFVVLLAPAGYSQQAAPFYQGKTITIIQGRSPGGTGDMRVRALMPFLQKYIPGTPGIVAEFMPGGGGRKAANHIYGAARPDGLTIANVGAGLVSNAILKEPGVQYDVDKLTFLGTGNSRTSYIFYTRKEVSLDSLEKLRGFSGLRIGAQSVGHDIYINGRIFAWLLDLKNPRFVTGYSGPEIDLALLRGEVDARAQIADNVPHRNPELIDKKLVHFHAILEFPRGFRFHHPVFDPLPALQTLAKSDMEKKVLQMFVNFRLAGSPYILPPNTPKDRVEILKEAFRKALKDPQFTVAMKNMTGADSQPLVPEEHETVVKEISRDPEVIKLFHKIAGAEPLPPR